jgi:hypothetical protein
MRAIYLDLASQRGHQLVRYPVRIFFILGLSDWAGGNHSYLSHKIFLLAIVLTKSDCRKQYAKFAWQQHN